MYHKQIIKQPYDTPPNLPHWIIELYYIKFLLLHIVKLKDYHCNVVWYL